MTAKMNQQLLAPYMIDGVSSLLGEPGAGVSLDNKVLLPQRARLTLSGLSIPVLAANDYGSAKLLDLPDRNLLLLAMEVDCTVVKGGVASGLVSTVDLDMAIGTAPASAAALASTMIDVIEKVDLDDDSLTVQFEKHSSDQATAAFPLKLLDSATLALYMNVGLPVGITANDALTVSGVIDILYVDLGNLIS